MVEANVDWTVTWAPALMDDTLRAKIVGQKKFATRIEQDLLTDVEDCVMPLAIVEDETAKIDALIARFDDELRVLAGLYFAAPLLPHSLQPLTGIADTTVTRERLQAVVAGRDHRAASFARVPTALSHLRQCGEECLRVWISHQPRMIAERLSIRMPPAQSQPAAHPIANEARYDAIELALSLTDQGDAA